MNDKNDPDFEASLHEAMKKAGFIFPETEEDLDSVLAHMDKMRASGFPAELDDPEAILRNGRLTLNSPVDDGTDAEVEENLARAAREGGEINEEVSEQMKKDRKRADDEHNDRTAG